MTRLVLLFCLLLTSPISFLITAYSQDKCTNSTDYFLCDPGFENNYNRSGSAAPIPDHRSGEFRRQPQNDYSYLQINRCLGGPVTNPTWADEYHWNYNSPNYVRYYYNQILFWDLPEFISWYEPTKGTPDYFHSLAYNFPNFSSQLVRVPNNFAGYQEPIPPTGQGQSNNAYIGIESYMDSHEGVWKEYVQCILKQPLLIGNTYKISFKVNHANNKWLMKEWQSLKQIGAYLSNGPLLNDTRGNIWLASNDLFYPQVTSNNQTDGILSDSANWMTVEQTVTITRSNKTHITIGNFQSYSDFMDDLRPIYPYTGFNQKFIWGCYYYIDNVKIEQVVTPEPCYCYLHNIKVIANNPPVDNQCCYTVKVQSHPMTCPYNTVRITNLGDNSVSEYFKDVDENSLRDFFIRDDEYWNEISSNYCINRNGSSDPVSLRIEFIDYDAYENELVSICSTNVVIRCNCACNDINKYSHYGNSDKRIEITAEPIPNSCCFDLYIENYSICEIPFNTIKLDYTGLDFSNITFSDGLNGFTKYPGNNSVMYIKSNPAIIPNNQRLKIGTICVPQNGLNQIFIVRLGSGENNWCDREWGLNLKCNPTPEDCCEDILCSLENSWDNDANAPYISPLCCWYLKVSNVQSIGCPGITKMEVFNHDNLSIPIMSIDNPDFNNVLGKIFHPAFCIDFGGWDENGTLSGSLNLKVKFWVGNTLVCVKDLSEECSMGYQGQFNKIGAVIGEHIINLDNITIKPNPFSDKTTIEFTLDKEEFVSLEVYNSIGDRLSTLVSSSLGKGLHKQILDGESYPNGAYYLKFTHGDKSVTIPIVKIK